MLAISLLFAVVFFSFVLFEFAFKLPILQAIERFNTRGRRKPSRKPRRRGG